MALRLPGVLTILGSMHSNTCAMCIASLHIYIYRYRCDYFSSYSIRFFYILIFFHSISFVFPHVFPPFPATSSHALVSSPIGTQQNLRVLACDKNANSCRVVNKKPYNIHSYFAYKNPNVWVLDVRSKKNTHIFELRRLAQPQRVVQNVWDVVLYDKQIY